MEIILKETIDTLGQEGDIVKVKPGYARNYLVPRQKAVLVNKASLARLDKEKQAIAAKLADQKKRADSLAGQIEGKVVIIARRTGDENRLFGSVTSGDIAGALQQQGIAIDKKAISLADPIKTIGEFKVVIKTGYQMTAAVLVQVVPETIGDAQ